MARQRELFPPDRALQARMALALVAAVVSVVLLIAVLAWLAVAVHWVLAGLVLVYAATGLAATVRPGKRVKRASTAPLAPDIERRVRELLGRLAAMSDVRTPQLALEPDDAPLSWTTALPWRPARIHVTTGLVFECTAAELDAVLAHELAHIANRDALVMTLVGPPSWVLLGIQEAVRESDEPFLRRVIGIAGISWIVALALPGALAARMLSRHRELAADRGAALLTGSPAGVAAALRRLSDSAVAPDLRLALLFFVPRGPATWALWATHPPLERRLAQLDRLERSLHDRG